MLGILKKGFAIREHAVLQWCSSLIPTGCDRRSKKLVEHDGDRRENDEMLKT